MKLNRIANAPIFFCLLGLLACGDGSSNQSKSATQKPKNPIETKESEDLAAEITKIANDEILVAANDPNPRTPEEIRSTIADKVKALQKDKNISDQDFLKGLLFLEQESLFTYLMKLRYLGVDREFKLPQDEKEMRSLVADLAEISDPDTGELSKAFAAKGYRTMDSVQAEYRGYNQESRANFMAMRELGYEPTNGKWESEQKKKLNQSKVDKLLKREKEIDRLIELNDEDFGRVGDAMWRVDPISKAQARGQKFYKYFQEKLNAFEKEKSSKAEEDEKEKRRKEEELKKQVFPN